MTAGTIGAICGTPADVALVRMCVDNRLPESQRRNYKRPAVYELYHIIYMVHMIWKFYSENPKKCIRRLEKNYQRRGYFSTVDRLWTNHWSRYSYQRLPIVLFNSSKRRNIKKNVSEGRIFAIISRCNDCWIDQLICLTPNRHCENEVTKYEGEYVL